MSKRYICPEAEGLDLNGARRLILTELFENRDNVNTDKLITDDGMKNLFFEDVLKKNDVRRGVFGFDTMLRYLDFFNIPAELKTIAEIATATGTTITLNFTDTSNYFWRFRSLSELTSSPYWFTVFGETGITLLIPERAAGSVYRGTVTEDNLIGSSRHIKTGILFTGESGAVIANFPDISVIVPETLDDTRKKMFDNKSKSLADTITFSAGDGFYAEPGDWVSYGTAYIIVSRRENDGSPVYTAVREITDSPAYATADIPFAELYDALNAANAGAVGGYRIDPTGFADGEMLQVNETLKTLERRPSGAFRARLTSNQTLTLAGTYYVLALATEDWDDNGWWDTATYRFTPQKPGKYFIKASARLTAAITAGNSFNIAIYKNNGQVTVKWVSQAGAVNSMVIDVSDEINFNGTTDYIDIRCSCGDAGKIVNANTLVTFVTGHRSG